MKKTLLKLTALLLTLTHSLPTWADEQAQALLVEMSQATQKGNYDLSFIAINPLDTLSLRYRHIYENDKTYAQLLSLDNSPQEIIQRDNLISYFGNNYQPFSLYANNIVDNLPNVLRTDFTGLTENYDFTNIGRNRIANRVVQTIRIQPKDNFRYQYVLFIDEQNHLLLRSDLLDREGNLLEQFRVLNMYMLDDPNPLLNYINSAYFPPSINQKNVEPLIEKMDWAPSWVPNGFHQIKTARQQVDNDLIESQSYSDQLFSFNLYVSDSALPENQEMVWKQGAYTIYSETINNKEVTLIGQIPLTTAKRIVQDVQFHSK
ncbi:MucB/RseB-like sigma(E) regulatory protein [Volucribacter psittacicida]|uniref:MucB/RseB-like sigma(E) regulatory protein n=1 Tax=Volucribacter psittacicida TaxID=203482 RepID=A0A4R1FTX7_9PAST|nr:sigma-E factor regulatory protein RseB [Volucribacter psittacicida]TCJ98756.1 MucB/RseB-like sigma(E) regulatory protein [Volucribacter psittacicida]